MSTVDAVGDPDRRGRVLDSALSTFARQGFRRTSMEQVARDADISRQGLYFLFATKRALFAAAATRALTHDLEAAERALRGPGTLAERLLAAFDHWTGRYVGPIAREVPALIAENPDLLDGVAQTAPEEFDALLRRQLAEGGVVPGSRVARVAQTLTSASIGTKQQVATREDYRDRMAVVIDVVLGHG